MGVVTRLGQKAVDVDRFLFRESMARPTAAEVVAEPEEHDRGINLSVIARDDDDDDDTRVQPRRKHSLDGNTLDLQS